MTRAQLDERLAQALAAALLAELRVEDARTKQEATGAVNADGLETDRTRGRAIRGLESYTRIAS
jgi:hypothetical protein